MTEALNPCPRCQKKPPHALRQPRESDHWIECSGCGFGGRAGDTVEEANWLWNEYKPEAPAPAVVEVRDQLVCPRCGERHAELKVYELTNRHWALSDGWAWCPTLQQPIIFVPQNIGQSPAC